jgi:hypothetical protein
MERSPDESRKYPVSFPFLAEKNKWVPLINGTLRPPLFQGKKIRAKKSCQRLDNLIGK